jgi:hypothetical protein
VESNWGWEDDLRELKWLKELPDLSFFEHSTFPYHELLEPR